MPIKYMYLRRNKNSDPKITVAYEVRENVVHFSYTVRSSTDRWDRKLARTIATARLKHPLAFSTRDDRGCTIKNSSLQMVEGKGPADQQLLEALAQLPRVYSVPNGPEQLYADNLCAHTVRSYAKLTLARRKKEREVATPVPATP